MNQREMQKKIVESIKKKMEEKNVNQKKLASLSGLTEATISRYLTNNRTPNLYNLSKICFALETNLNELLGETL